jgi:diguanylate cyclase
MIYQDSIERSTEYLRQALPIMARQEAALHPVSYAVWYDYVAQRTPALRAAVEQYLQRDGKLDESSTEAIYRQHIAEVDPQTAQRVTDGFNRVLSGMAESAAEAGDQTARFGSSLTRVSERLENGGAGYDAQALKELLEGTREMSAAVGVLQSRLSQSECEITLLREEVRRARHESLLDSLTGLANRRAFDQRLAACLAASEITGSRGAPCLVVSDIDHFKRINDDFGHNFGDQVLRAVGEILKACAPGEGMAARIGGEEFAILLPEAALPDAQTLAEKIRHTVAASRIRRHGAQETLARVTLSLGVTLHRAGESVREFLERADKAMYASKSGGRDRVTVVPA